MSGAPLHAATEDEARRIWPALDAAHLFDSRSRFEEFHAEAPWRVQVTGSGEAVLLERWRAHLDVLAMKGVWCSKARVPDLVSGARRVARQQGFGRILSPLVDEEATSEYVQAGLDRHSSIVLLQRDRHLAPRITANLPDGVAIRPARSDDLPTVLALDGASFDEFWRYDAAILARSLAEDRMAVAEEAGEVIGYTLSTLMRASGTLGRLAVTPRARRRGVGAGLLAEAIGYLERRGAGHVTLCTQAENRASRELYRRMGLAEVPGARVFLIGPADPSVASG